MLQALGSTLHTYEIWQCLNTAQPGTNVRIVSQCNITFWGVGDVGVGCHICNGRFVASQEFTFTQLLLHHRQQGVRLADRILRIVAGTEHSDQSGGSGA